MKRVLLAFCLVFPGLSFAGPMAPPKGKTLLIIGQDVKNILSYARAPTPEPGGISVYTSAEFADGLFHEVDHGGGLQHAEKLIKKFPDSAVLVGLYMVHTEDKIIHGDVDDSLGEIAEWVKKAGVPVYFRIGYEFDFEGNDYDPKQYVLAYQRIVDLFRGWGVDNAAFVWHSFAGKTEKNRMKWYPGDKYVDWIAVSYFQNPRKYLDEVAAIAKKQNKPLMIAESSPWQVNLKNTKHAWDNWFAPYFKFIEKNDVRAVSYVNCHWDKIPLFHDELWGDARLQQNKDLLKLWLKKTGEPRFLHGGKETLDILRKGL